MKKKRVSTGTGRSSPPHRKRPTSFECACCRRTFRFCWYCRCGFAICQECMLENAWGMTCNQITWQCPDCGRENGFGNQ